MATSGELIAYVGINEGEGEGERSKKLKRMERGKLNLATFAVFTLDAGEAETILEDQAISAQSVILLMPLTANAAAAMATTYCSARTKGAATFAHAISVATDLDFAYVVFN